MQLIVVGFHRSGTSLVAQLLHRAGVFLGEELLGAMPSNPHGHFEDLEVLRIHQDTMTAAGTSWQVDAPIAFHLGVPTWDRMRALAERRAGHPLWGFKDPRVCLFLGAWKAVLPDARFLVVYRDPGECVRSLTTRAASEIDEAETPPAGALRFFREPDHGLRLWDTYNRAVVDFVRAHPDDCLVVPYSRLPEGYPLVDAVNERFGADLAPVGISQVFDASLAGRADHPQWVHDPTVAARVTETWTALEDLARRTEPWT